MREHHEILNDIAAVTSPEQLQAIGQELQLPRTVICPYNKRYAQLPQVCVGYAYVCPHLHPQAHSCQHPETRQWISAHLTPTLRVQAR